MRKRIVILVHENSRLGRLGRWLGHQSYFVNQLVHHWRNDGLEVHFFNDPDRPIPGDLLFMHVDLSVVPQSYLDLARAYPATINAGVGDIRKSVISRQLVGADDAWEGPVIVKTDLNHGGFPEQRYGGARRPRPLPSMRSPGDYPVYPHRRDVPAGYFDNPDLVVERFLPERHGDGYCVRCYCFLGDQEDTLVLHSRHPVVKLGAITGIDISEAHSDILEMRRTLGFDYGKFDYVIRDGRAILLDANKTPGHLAVKDAETADMVRRRARAIRSCIG